MLTNNFFAPNNLVYLQPFDTFYMLFYSCSEEEREYRPTELQQDEEEGTGRSEENAESGGEAAVEEQ